MERVPGWGRGESGWSMETSQLWGYRACLPRHPPCNLDPIQLSLRQARPLRGPKEPLICAGLAGPLSPWDSVFAKNHKELSIELALDVGWAGEKAGEGEEGGLHLRPRQGCVEGVAFSLFLRHV